MPHRVTDDGATVRIGDRPTQQSVTPTQMYPLKPGVFNLGVYRGDTYEWSFQLLAQDDLPIDIAGWRVKAEIRPSVDAPLMASLQEIGREDAEGIVRMRLTSNQSRQITQSGVWDMEVVTSDGWVKTVLSGTVDLQGDVTTGYVDYESQVL